MQRNGSISNGSISGGLMEYFKMGLIHSPSGRLLTSETFQGSLNVSGMSLKRKQMWTVYTDPANPAAFIFRNHLGLYLSANHNGKVSLVNEEACQEERWLVHFDAGASGLISLQSEAHSFYLEWANNEVRCFSKEPIWWGLRLAMHPQMHLKSVQRSNYIRSANNDSELRAVTKMPSSFKFLIWLEQLPLPIVNSRIGSGGQTTFQPTKEDVARLSKVAIRTQSGRYLCGDGSLVTQIDQCTLFTISFKPNKTPVIMFQNEHGEYLTVGAGGILKIKPGIREPRKEEFFAVETPSTQIRLWAFNKKFACNKHGLTFSSTMEETEEHKSTIYQLEYVGGHGLDTEKIVLASATPSADSAPTIFSLDMNPDGDNSPCTDYFPTGLWRLRSQDNRVWQLPPTGGAQLVAKDTEPHTCFKMLYVTSYEETLDNGSTKVCREGGVVLCTVDEDRIVSAKTLGAIGASDRCITPNWLPLNSEVFHMLPLINRPSLALYSPLACGYLSASSGRRIGSSVRDSVDCLNPNPEQWHLLHFTMGTCQLFAEQRDGWLLLTVKGDGSVGLVASAHGPSDEDSNAGGVSVNPETLFVICMTSDKYAILRSALPSKPSYLCTSIQGDVKLDSSTTHTPGCIWQI